MLVRDVELLHALKILEAICCDTTEIASRLPGRAQRVSDLATVCGATARVLTWRARADTWTRCCWRHAG